jgi:aryl-alcohol dehydrogenase-like predicted oxidoreductase
VVHEALQAGCNFFDTSPMYGDAERVLADAVRPVRDSALIATKVWTPSAEEGRHQVQRALRWFGGWVDVYQVRNLVATDLHLPYLEQLRVEGRVKVVGVTHYSHRAFPELLRWMEDSRSGACRSRTTRWTGRRSGSCCRGRRSSGRG